MKHIISAAVALGLSAGFWALQPVHLYAGADEKVTVVGCVVKGDGGYVLTTDAATVPAPTMPAGTTTVASATTVAGRVFYWLDDDDEIDEHAGQKVELTGELEHDVDQAKIAVERENGSVEIEFKADGERKVTVKVPDVPSTVGTSGAVGDREKDYRVVIRKIDVKTVKVLASSCR